MSLNLPPTHLVPGSPMRVDWWALSYPFSIFIPPRCATPATARSHTYSPAFLILFLFLPFFDPHILSSTISFSFICPFSSLGRIFFLFSIVLFFFFSIVAFVPFPFLFLLFSRSLCNNYFFDWSTTSHLWKCRFDIESWERVCLLLSSYIVLRALGKSLWTL